MASETLSLITVDFPDLAFAPSAVALFGAIHADWRLDLVFLVGPDKE